MGGSFTQAKGAQENASLLPPQSTKSKTFIENDQQAASG
jgi:hypothetical protein